MTDDDRQLLLMGIYYMQLALEGRTRFPFGKKQRKAAEAVFKALTGFPYRNQDQYIAEHQIEWILGPVLRGREEARFRERLMRERGVEVDTDDALPNGTELVRNLREYDGWVQSLDAEGLRRLARAIDAIDPDQINLSGAGGRKGGRTPEAWARHIARVWKDPQAAKAALDRTRRR